MFSRRLDIVVAVVAVGRWSPARCSCPSAAGACGSRRPEWKAPGRNDVPTQRTRERADRIVTAHGSARLGPWLADKRAARLGILALVGVIAVQPDRRPTVVPADRPGRVAAGRTSTPTKTRTVPAAARAGPDLRRRRPDPRRQQARAHRRRRLGRHPRRHRPGRDLPPPVGLGRRAGRGDGGALRRQALQPVPADAGRRGRHEETAAVAAQERVEDFPGVSIVRTGGARATRTRRSPATSSATWARSPPRTRTHYRPRLRHYVGERAGRPVRRRAEHGGGAARQVGRGASYEVDAANRIVRDDRATSRRSTASTSSCRSTSTFSSTPSRRSRPSSRLRRDELAANPEVASSPTANASRWTRRSPDRVPYKAPAGSVIVMDYAHRAGHGAGQLPDVRQPLVRGRRRRATSSSELFPEAEDADPDEPVLTNRAIQGQYNLGRRSSRSPPTPPWHRADRPERLSTTTRARTSCTGRSGRVRCRAGRAVRVQNATCARTQRPVRVRHGQRRRPPSPSRATPSSTARRGLLTCTPGTAAAGPGAASSASAPTPASTCRSSSTGRCPTNELKKRATSTLGVISEDETPNLQPGDLVQLAIGQGLLAATPLQLAVGYATHRQRRLRAARPQVVKAIYEPRVPDGEPGFADLAQATVMSDDDADRAARSRCRRSMRDADHGRHPRANITGPGANGRYARRPRSCSTDYPADAIPIAGKTGHRPGCQQLSRGTTRRRSPRSASTRRRPYTVVSVPREGGLRLARGAAPVVKCMFLALSGMTPLDPVVVSEPLDLDSDRAGATPLPHVDTGVHGRAPPARPRPPVGLAPMALSMLQRKPDSGLGNIRSSPADPSRNIDWVLMSAQAALTVIGCFVVFSATRTRIAPIRTRSSPARSIFAIVAAVVMVVVMAVDYEWLKERAAFALRASRSCCSSLLFVCRPGRRAGHGLASTSARSRLQPAEFAKFTVLLALCAYLAEERSDEVSYPRFLGGLMIVGVPAVLIIIQPDLGSASVLIAMAMGVLLVAGAKAALHRRRSACCRSPRVGAAFVGRLVNEYQLERRAGVLRREQPAAAGRRRTRSRNAVRAVGTGGMCGKGWLQGPLTNGRDIPVMWADFPFAAVGEQFGLVGCAVLLLAVRRRARAHLADRPPVARPARHVPVRRRVHDAAVADVPERRDDAQDHAGHRPADAVHLLRRLGPDHVVRHVRPRPERAHAPDALTHGSASRMRPTTADPALVDCRACPHSGRGSNRSWPGAEAGSLHRLRGRRRSPPARHRARSPGCSPTPTPTRSACPTRACRSSTRSSTSATTPSPSARTRRGVDLDGAAARATACRCSRSTPTAPRASSTCSRSTCRPSSCTPTCST